MMDFLLAHQQSPLQIKDFLSKVFECTAERIEIFSLDEFNCLTESIDACTLDCVCVFSFVRGDASQLLQLYRYKMNDSSVVKKVIDVALKNKIQIYIPDDSSGDWTYIGDGESKHVHQKESVEDNYFLFQSA